MKTFGTVRLFLFRFFFPFQNALTHTVTKLGPCQSRLRLMSGSAFDLEILLDANDATGCNTTHPDGKAPALCTVGKDVCKWQLVFQIKYIRKWLLI